MRILIILSLLLTGCFSTPPEVVEKFDYEGWEMFAEGTHPDYTYKQYRKDNLERGEILSSDGTFKFWFQQSEDLS